MLRNAAAGQREIRDLDIVGVEENLAAIGVVARNAACRRRGFDRLSERRGVRRDAKRDPTVGDADGRLVDRDAFEFPRQCAVDEEAAWVLLRNLCYVV